MEDPQNAFLEGPCFLNQQDMTLCRLIWIFTDIYLPVHQLLYIISQPMYYKISIPNPVNHYIHFEVRIGSISSSELTLKLPSWRPGRYELGNFAKNIRAFDVLDSRGMPLAFRKTSKDTWEVNMNGSSEAVIRYSYYAAQLDAGACWLDREQLYINPVHCFLYSDDRMHEKCEIELDIPKNYSVATSLKKKSGLSLMAEDFHELVDSPIIASSSLQSKRYTSHGAVFTIWFQGDVVPEWNKIIKDFQLFTDEQIRTMGSLPVPEFHFLIQVTPGQFYHGVEHLRSTVLAIGPGHQLMSRPLYNDLTGVASHELFHVWNVKKIRPADMFPYDYSRENYSRLGYVYEGVTTYYGDLFLARCGVYSVDEYFSELSARIQKHFDNYGRFNMSVADSSFDTWLDGYVPGVPDRKTSIYDEGCITALMTDILIRSKSGSRKSLDDVMKSLYDDFGRADIGYTEHDYMELVNQMAGESMIDFFMDYIYGTEDYEQILDSCLKTLACQLKKSSNPKYRERCYGFRTKDSGDSVKVTAVAPGSPADLCGLGKDDEIIAVNDVRVNGNLDELLAKADVEHHVLSIITPMRKLMQLRLAGDGREYFPLYKVKKNREASISEQLSFKAWLKKDFDPSEE